MILPRHYITGIIIFTLMIVSGVYIVAEFNRGNPGQIDSTDLVRFNRTFNKLSDVEDSVGSLQDNIENAPQDWGIFGVLNSLIKGAWNTMSLLFSSFGFMTDVFNGLATYFGVPAFVPALIGLLVVSMLAFAIYSAIFQRDI